ncbi:MAG TPA: protein phosphatase 2C domain-containing protein [Steroidobacter sp.]|uniref:PP2C family protein-serine/threonine phosphatase n=1 Tax=Steroidobacter sp. TaxID=1978227 RepID=UPI002EDAB128
MPFRTAYKRFAGRTHPGRRGGTNEDVIGWDEASNFWFVADGMGGHASGDVASRVVKETLLGEALALPLVEALRKAHESVAATAKTNSAYDNMGATVVATRIAERQAEIAWVGDSRAYLWRDGSLSALTRDHSFLEVLRTQENLSEEQLRTHPNRNLVTKTLGIGTPEPSVARLPLQRRDWLILCSDGLNDELEDREIADVLRSQRQPEGATEALIDAALAKGGRDNVSAVVVEYDGPDAVSFSSAMSQKLKPLLPMMVSVLGGVAAATGVAVLWWWFYGR